MHETYVTSEMFSVFPECTIGITKLVSTVMPMSALQAAGLVANASCLQHKMAAAARIKTGEETGKLTSNTGPCTAYSSDWI